MGSKFSNGFTIIELMLFLAITGLLIAGILANASNSLNDQHYREGVESVRNKLSAQFAKVYSLTNDSPSSGSMGNVDPCEAIAGNTSVHIQRGTSGCFYVGRLVEVVPGDQKSQLRITPVVAKPRPGFNAGQFYANQQSSGASATSGGVTELNARYQIAKYDGNTNLVESDQFDWGLAAVNPGAGNSMLTMSLLILRSPIDGTVQAYNLLAKDPGTIDYNNLGSRLNSDYANDVKFCLADLTGSLDPPQRLAIIVHKSATNSSDVETRLNKAVEAGGGPEC